MALGAADALVRTGEREAGLAVIAERRGSPGVHAVAAVTLRYETTRDMVGVLGVLEAALVASVAVGGCPGIATGRVAARTIDPLMSASQSEARLGVIEARWLPGVRRVAVGARGWKAPGHVVGILGVLEAALVAGVAVCRSARVLSARVAAGAVDALVCTRERKTRPVVIAESGWPPAVERVASGALGGEGARHMVGVPGVLEVVQVAGVAVGWCACIPAPGVAAEAVHRSVAALQREPGGVMVEGSGPPGARRVTVGAQVRETRGDVVGVRRLLVVRLVAAVAVDGRSGIASTRVAARAVDPAVCPSQGKACPVVVVEARGVPGARGVATRAGRREVARGVAGIAGRLVVRLVASVTVGRRPRIAAASVATATVDATMRARQGKACPVVVVEAGGVPGVRGVAIRTGSGEVANDMVGVLRRPEGVLVAAVAVDGRSGKASADMACGAVHALVRAGERKARGVVVDKGCGLPGIRVVARRAGVREC